MANLMFPHLFSPIKIGNVEIKNRVVHSPHGNESADGRGFIRDRGFYYLVERAKGGAGLVVIGDVNVEEGGSPTAVSLAKEYYIPILSDLVTEVHYWGAKMFAHLHLSSTDPIFQVWKVAAGGKAEEIATVSGESPEPGMKARQITIEEIESIQDTYAAAARRAKVAGFDGVSVNGSFGFLPAQFLASKANKRTDKYGGDVIGRTRFITELIQKIRAKTDKDFPFVLKLSGDELREGGLTLEDTVEVAPILERGGLSALWLVGGTQSMREQHRVSPPMGSAPFGCYVRFAEAVKKVVKIPVITGTRINDPQLAEEIVRDGRADMVAIARQSMADPYWAKKAREGRVEDINKCIYCNRCLQSIWPFLSRHLKCTVNPSMYKEREYAIKPALQKKKVLVVGGGPAGMQAALVLHQRGHEVTLCEKSGQLGGQLLLAARAPHKEEIGSFTQYLTTQVKKAGVPVKLDQEVTPDMVREIKPDAVIVATGASPLVPEFPGVKGKNVVTAWDVLSDKAQVGERVVIAGGGMVGCEVAERFVLQGKNVTVIEMLQDIAMDVEWSLKMHLKERFAKYKMDIKTGTKVEEIIANGVLVTDSQGNKQEITGDTVVLALGSVANSKLATELQDEVAELYAIGDCKKPYRILEAVHEAAYIARQI